MFAILRGFLSPEQVPNHPSFIVKQYWNISKLWKTETPQHAVYLCQNPPSPSQWIAKISVPKMAANIVFCPLRWLMSGYTCTSTFCWYLVHVTEACRFVVLSKGLQPMCSCQNGPELCTLEITVSDELKLVNICHVFAMLCGIFRPRQGLNHHISITKQ